MSLQQTFGDLRVQLAKRIIGQDKLVDRLLIALLADGHLLVEGAPGLAKTTAVKALADHLEGDFHRIQFTPDLLPSDVTGSEIYRAETGLFEFQRGPIFHNLVLADEINRAPAKVQSALLEAMGERQISVGMQTFSLPRLFMVMATQNPIEQEGTYPLPEAQLDRFLLHVLVGYPDAEGERAILALNRAEARGPHGPGADRELFAASDPLTQDEVIAARHEVLDLYLADPLEEYIVQIVLATRDPGRYGEDLAGVLQYGASPRATIALDRCSRARAWLAGREYVTPEDIQDVAHDILRHRVLLSFEAEAAGRTPDEIIDALLARIGVP